MRTLFLTIGLIAFSPQSSDVELAHPLLDPGCRPVKAWIECFRATKDGGWIKMEGL